MAGESNKAQDTEKNLEVLATEKNDSATTVKKQQRGVISGIWNGFFRQHGDAFEKRLQHISKEEATVLARMKKRSRSWRRMIRHLIIFSVIFEVIAVIYAIMTTRYDPDPAAKAAAATVLASKLGTDSGLKVYVGDDSKLNAPTGKSNDVEIVQSTGLRHRNQPRTRSSSTGSPLLQHTDEQMLRNTGSEGSETSEHDQVVVEHHNPGSTKQDGGWIARIAALLVGEDPTQSYALICGNCHIHNGLARKEDFPYIVYYCPHCNALNGSKPIGVSGPNSPSMSPKMAKSSTQPDSGGVTVSEMIPASSSPVTAAVENTEGSGRLVSGVLDPISPS